MKNHVESENVQRHKGGNLAWPGLKAGSCRTRSPFLKRCASHLVDAGPKHVTAYSVQGVTEALSPIVGYI
jgi:hypothetical protein